MLPAPAAPARVETPRFAASAGAMDALQKRIADAKTPLVLAGGRRMDRRGHHGPATICRNPGAAGGCLAALSKPDRQPPPELYRTLRCRNAALPETDHGRHRSAHRHRPEAGRDDHERLFASVVACPRTKACPCLPATRRNRPRLPARYRAGRRHRKLLHCGGDLGPCLAGGLLEPHKATPRRLRSVQQPRFGPRTTPSPGISHIWPRCSRTMRL